MTNGLSEGGLSLKPCPFCGTTQENDRLKVVSPDDNDCHVHCETCWASGPMLMPGGKERQTEAVAIARWNALSRRSLPGSDAGEWVLVPREATEAMIEAMDKAWEDKPSNSWGNAVDLTPEEAWAAMLSAAPKPPSSPVDETPPVTSFPPAEQYDVSHMPSHASAASPDEAQGMVTRDAVIEECIAAIHGDYPIHDEGRDPYAGPPQSADFRRGWDTLREKVLNRLRALAGHKP